MRWAAAGNQAGASRKAPVRSIAYTRPTATPTAGATGEGCERRWRSPCGPARTDGLENLCISDAEGARRRCGDDAPAPVPYRGTGPLTARGAHRARDRARRGERAGSGSLMRAFGAAPGLLATLEEADDFIRSERVAWERRPALWADEVWRHAMRETRRQSDKPQHPAVAAARRDRALMAAMQQSTFPDVTCVHVGG